MKKISMTTRMTRKRDGLTLLAVAAGLLASTVANAQTYSKTETVTYYDNTAKWVLGQVASVTCSDALPANPANTGCDGDVVSSTTFDPTYALPLKTYSFGKLQQTLTYDTTSTIESGQRGTLKTVSDGRDSGTYNTTITFTGWTRGIPELISYPDGTTQSAQVNANGWIDWVENEAGFTTSYTYDAMGRLASIDYPDEASPPAYNNTTTAFIPVAATEYGIPAGHWRQIVDTDNGRQVTYYDAMWRPLVVDRYDEGNVAATRSVTVTRYDTDGRVAFQSYPRASISSYADATLLGTDTSYDALGRVLTVAQDNEIDPTQPLVTATAYLSNAEGAYLRVTNPRGYQIRIWHQAFDQPSTDQPVEIRGPEGTFTTIARDPFGKPTSIRRHDSTDTVGNTRSYTYNDYQELCRTVEPETGAKLMGYDAAGNLAWTASGLPDATACDSEGDTAAILARKAVRDYDQRGRVSTLAFVDGQGDTTYDYTPDGLLASIVAENGSNVVTHNYTYNNRRLLVNEQMSWGTINWNVTRSYNTNGHLASETYPGNLAVAYAPNALGQPTQAGSYATGVTYHPNGGIKQFTYGNGIVHTMTQNARQLPDRSLDAYGTTKFLDDGYDYDGNANVAAISDGSTIGTPQRGNRTMTYDGLDRLKTVASPMYGTNGASYAYDVLDNLTRVVAPGRDHHYCYDEHWRLTNVKTTSCSGATVVGLDYDVQGNLANKNGTTYAFDYGNRLRTVDPAGTTEPSISYVYDGHGRRVRDLSGEARYSFYSQAGQLAFTSDSRADKYTNYVYLGGSLVATREWAHGTTTPFTTKYQHTDALGSPVVVTDANRNVLERSEYEPYGQVLNRPVSDGPGYTGHVMDAATGLAYMQQRYYDPMIGRFLSVDPVAADSATGANFNRYWYGNNNPYRFTDPDGRWAEDLFVGVPSLIIGLKSGYDNVRSGNYGAAIVDGIGVIADGAAIALPGVPGGAGLGIKAARNVDRVVDAAKGADNAKDGARFVGQPDGTVVDTHATPAGSYDQPNGARTDVLQSADHGAGHSHTHDKIVNTNPRTGETFVNGEQKPGRPVNFEEAENIRTGRAVPSEPKGR